jgi:hypothetical protein
LSSAENSSASSREFIAFEPQPNFAARRSWRMRPSVMWLQDCAVQACAWAMARSEVGAET